MTVVTALLAFIVTVHLVGVSAWSWSQDKLHIYIDLSRLVISQALNAVPALDAVPANADHGLSSMEHVKVYRVGVCIHILYH